ncbi:hypothetical protein EV122DRAFT_274120 [Schizophyllum commune]
MATSDMPPPPPHFDPNLKYGPAFIGCIIAGILYGIACNQTYSYYKGRFQDPKLMRVFVYTLLLLETTHLILTIHVCYFYMITNYNNSRSTDNPTWSFLIQMVVETMTDVSIRGFFARRVWILARPQSRRLAWVLVLCIGAMSVFAFSCSVALTSRTYMSLDSNATHDPNVRHAWFNQVAYLLYASFGCSVVGDMVIAVSMCALLSRSRTGAIETDSIIDVLVLYAMATGLSTRSVLVLDASPLGFNIIYSLGEIVCFISYAVRKHDLIFVGVYFTLSTLSLNSFLASLNARSAFRNRERARTASAMMVLNTLPASAHSSADTHTLFDSSAKSGEAFSDGPSHGDGNLEHHHLFNLTFKHFPPFTMVQPKSYSQGDRIEYRPIGGTSDKVTHSTGEIIRIEGDGEDAKYTIRNDNTGKETTYQSMNIVGPAQ